MATVKLLITQFTAEGGSCDEDNRGAEFDYADVYSTLIDLGEPAVGAIVAQSDDRRPLPCDVIRSVNHPLTRMEINEGASSSYPELAVDVLSEILVAITNVSFDRTKREYDRQQVVKA